MFDFDSWNERAAIMEFDGGLSRFAAETAASKRQGLERWEVLRNADNLGYSQPARDHVQATQRQPTERLPGVQREQTKQAGSVSERRVQE